LVSPIPPTNFAVVLQDAAESQYQSNKKLPLGKTPIRGFHFTEEIRNNPDHAFGVPTPSCLMFIFIFILL
jgi:hypothetical protein